MFTAGITGLDQNQSQPLLSAGDDYFLHKLIASQSPLCAMRPMQTVSGAAGPPAISEVNR